jgi:hypothetical protein
MGTPLWPIDVLWPQKLNVDLAPRSLAAPSSVSGVTQVVASDAGIWKITYDAVPVIDEQKVKAWRAIANLLEGRLGSILVPITRFYQPVPDGSEPLYEPVPHSDDAFFDDGTGYVGRVIDVVTVGSMALRAVSGTVAVNYAGQIEPGQHFSVGERLYRVRTFNPDTGAITFRPPLREAVPSGTNLEFDEPVVRMRLATDGEMDLPLDLGRFSFPSVNFVEDL